MNTTYDVAIIGGSFAGLAAATALGRSLRRVVVLDGGAPRNAPSPGAHNVLANDGAAPADLLARARRDAEAYGVELHTAEVHSAENSTEMPGDEFSITLTTGEHLTARRILLATGTVDHLPEIPGLAEHWGTRVLHCPYCHGWEVRGERIGVIATHMMASHQALLFSQLGEVDFILHNDAAATALTADQRADLAAAGVTIIEGPIAEVTSDENGLSGVVLASGERRRYHALTVQSRLEARAGVFEQLGGAVSENPMGTFIETDLRKATNVPGVWAAGNVSEPAAMVTQAAASGTMAGAGLNADLIAADVRAKRALTA